MPKLHEVIALVGGRKTETQRKLSDLHQQTQKADLFKGLYRTYKPRDDADTEVLASEKKELQLRVPDVLMKLENTVSDLYDLVITQDSGNTKAKADVVVSGVTLLKDVPVTTLLYLEKQLDDLKKFYDTLPTLDPSVEWTFDTQTRSYRTTSKTHRAVRYKTPLVLYPATDKHPAQVQVIEEDKIVGDWTKVDTSGAVSATDKAKLLERVRLLKDAVIVAREKANTTSADNVKMSDTLFEFLHTGLV